VLADMAAYPWPGNVRELRNVVERAMILTPGGTLDAVGIAPATPVAPRDASSPGGDLNLRATLDRREREVLLLALARSGGVRKEAARLLGIDQRNLGYYFRKHAIDPDQPDGEGRS
jgi:DNA-binding NtrC family response regulator